MTKRQLQKAAIPELVSAYAEVARANGSASDDGDHKKANKAFDRIASIYTEVRRRGVEAQKALLPLLFDADPWVRLWSATHALDFAAAEGAAVLERLVGAKGALAVDARYTLEAWRNGTLRFP